MHSTRDANSFSRAPPRVQRSVNPLFLSLFLRTNEQFPTMERVPLLFLPSCSSRRNIRLRDKLREVVPFFSLSFLSLSVLLTSFRFNRRRSLFNPRHPRKGYNFQTGEKESECSPRFNRANDINHAGRAFFEGEVWRTFDPFFFAGTTNIPSITIFLEGRAGYRESSVGWSRVDSGLAASGSP